jgi:hypothetical protein
MAQVGPNEAPLLVGGEKRNPIGHFPLKNGMMGNFQVIG